MDPEEKDLISGDSNKILSLGTLKRILSMSKLKRTFIILKPEENAVNEDPHDLTLHDFCAAK